MAAVNNTVGAWSLTTFTTPTSGERPISSAELRGNFNALQQAHVGHDADAGLHVQQSTVALRPAAGVAGRLWYTTDDNRLWRDNGVAWVAPNYADLSTANTFAAQVTVNAGMLIPFNQYITYQANGTTYTPFLVNGSGQAEIRLAGNYLAMRGIPSFATAGALAAYLPVYNADTGVTYKIPLYAF